MARLVIALALFSLTLSLAAAPAGAAQRPISGKLSKRGYTVVALAANGRADSVLATTGTFKLVPPASRVTLHLLHRGRYAGPVVVGLAGKRAIVGVRAGAKLGAVRVLRGYARTKRALSRKLADRSRTARALNGKPVGAGLLGRVRKTAGRAAQGEEDEPPPGQPPPGQTPPPPSGPPPATDAGADPDSDGLPNAFDTDDNGNLVLDNTDRTGGRSGFGVFAQIFLQLDETVNANAGAISDALIDQRLAEKLTLVFTQVPEDTELDCGGLSYCSPGGTGRQYVPPEEEEKSGSGKRFPEEFDSDGDGFGTISGGGQGPTGLEFALLPGAPAAAIRAGDSMIERVAGSGGEIEIPGALNFVFNTVPALTHWADGSGGEGTFTYPVSPGDPGTRDNPFIVVSDERGDIVLRLTFWRPQRRALPGEGRGWVDIGRLAYSIQIPGSGDRATDGPECPQETFSSDDPNLAPAPLDRAGKVGALADKAADAPASPNRRLTFTINVTRCFASKGGYFPIPSIKRLHLSAIARGDRSVDHAQQTFWIRRDRAASRQPGGTR